MASSRPTGSSSSSQSPRPPRASCFCLRLRAHGARVGSSARRSASGWRCPASRFPASWSLSSALKFSRAFSPASTKAWQSRQPQRRCRGSSPLRSPSSMRAWRRVRSPPSTTTGLPHSGMRSGACSGSSTSSRASATTASTQSFAGWPSTGSSPSQCRRWRSCIGHGKGRSVRVSCGATCAGHSLGSGPSWPASRSHLRSRGLISSASRSPPTRVSAR